MSSIELKDAQYGKPVSRRSIKVIKVFKYLRIITAIALVICTIVHFSAQLYYQSKGGFDGPLAHFMSYNFRMNNIVLAVLLAVILLFDFTLNLPSWGRLFMRWVGIISTCLVLMGFVFLFEQQRFAGGFFLMMMELYMFQIAYLLVSLVVLGKSYDADWNQMQKSGEANA